jgi:hypothetical protein
MQAQKIAGVRSISIQLKMLPAAESSDKSAPSPSSVREMHVERHFEVIENTGEWRR